MYSVILADPPWDIKKGGLRKSRPNQGRALDYSTLSLEEISDHLFNATVRAQAGASLFLWTVDKYLFEAQEIAERFGWKLHARMIWDKQNGVAPAFTVRFTHEYLLWFYKSPMQSIAKGTRGKFTTLFQEAATVHSKKPLCVYEMIEAMYPHAAKLEMYARGKRLHWDSWGNEVENDIILDS